MRTIDGYCSVALTKSSGIIHTLYGEGIPYAPLEENDITPFANIQDAIDACRLIAATRQNTIIYPLRMHVEIADNLEEAERYLLKKQNWVLLHRQNNLHYLCGPSAQEERRISGTNAAYLMNNGLAPYTRWTPAWEAARQLHAQIGTLRIKKYTMQGKPMP